METTNRRDFLRSVAQSATVISVGAHVPVFWREAAAAPLGHRDTILVVLQLSGGNDGLNTVVPFADEAYRRARPTLAISRNNVLKIDDQIGLHPAARGLADLLEDGQLAIVQGVGYPQPNRSHFESMDIWHTCLRKGGLRTTGWLGRYFDGLAATPHPIATPGIHLGGDKQPLALIADDVRVPSISSPEKFRLQDRGSPALRDAIRDLADRPQDRGNDLLGFLQTSTSAALSDSERITAALREYQTPVKYPEHALGRKIKTVGQLISAGFNTRVYYLELDGFDTHAQQAAAHAALWQQAGGALHAFLQDMVHQGQADRVLVMCFSEFGRRVQENASEGTDHGAAAPMFLAGKRVRAGLIGKHPSLTNLENGDLKFHTDFRQVYATVLEQWLGWDSSSVLAGRFHPVPAIDVV